METSRKRILFVDDHAPLLKAMRLALRRESHRWDAEFFIDPLQAIAAAADTPFDVAIADIDMPGLQGVELLTQLREISPGTARVLYSARMEPEMFVRAAPIMHRWLVKPCAGEQLRLTIEALCNHQAALGADGIRLLLGEGGALPSVPRVYLELCRAAERPTSGADDFAEIVSADPAIAARLLQLANSSYFGIAQRTSSIHRACVHLGVEMLKALALGAHLFAAAGDEAGLPSGLRIEALQRSAMLSARLARELAASGDGDAAFTAGMLRDLGTLALLPRARDRLCAVYRHQPRAGASRADVERKVFGATLPAVGGYLLGMWGLPEPIVEAVTHTADLPTHVPLGLRGAVAVACAIADEHFEVPPKLALEALDAPHFDLLRWRARAREIATES